MNRFVPLFIVLCLAFIHGEKMRYDDYTVVRLYGLNQTDVYELEENYDVWTKNRIFGWADVMVHQSLLEGMFQKYPNYEVRIPNVQTQIDTVEASRPTNPQAFFDDFPTTEETNAWVAEQVAANPGLARHVEIGRTYQGSIIRGVFLGANPASPTYFFQCTIHAREWITTTTCCWIIDQLLNKDPEGKDILQRNNFIIVPILNIDGYDFTHNSQRLWRKNREPNSGSTCIGTDLNRNYDARWSGPGASPNPCSDTYYGSSAASSPEISSEQNYISNIPNLVSFVDIHTSGAMFMSPYGFSTAYPPEYDIMDYYMELGVRGIQSENGITYAYGTVANVIYQVSGGSNDWAYEKLGLLLSYAIEIYGSGFTVPPSSIPLRGEEIYQGLKAVVKGAETVTIYKK